MRWMTALTYKVEELPGVCQVPSIPTAPEPVDWTFVELSSYRSTHWLFDCPKQRIWHGTPPRTAWLESRCREHDCSEVADCSQAAPSQHQLCERKQMSSVSEASALEWYRNCPAQSSLDPGLPLSLPDTSVLTVGNSQSQLRKQQNLHSRWPQPSSQL